MEGGAVPASDMAHSEGTFQSWGDSCAVQVAVHIRPLIQNEVKSGCREVLSVLAGTSQIHVPPNAFTYDFAFGSREGKPPRTLYTKCVRPLVDGLFKGYNATVFAYGQTGSGKTYTMGSTFSDSGSERGVIPDVINTLFQTIESRPGTNYAVRVGFVEIHQEVIRDLLSDEPAGQQPEVAIREVAGGGVCLSGAREQEVRSREELSQVLSQGSLQRATAATGMNRNSSRSHAVFTITLEQRRQVAIESFEDGVEAPAVVSNASCGDTVEEYISAKMHLVDLAGSERVKRTHAEGARLAEGISINRGLFALGNVINALSSQGSFPTSAAAVARHVPYRDSKLTRMLQDSLGGNSRTVMIACVSPADVNLEESINTLRYAARARNIRNKPVVNHDPNAAQVAVLRQQLAASRAEVSTLREIVRNQSLTSWNTEPTRGARGADVIGADDEDLGPLLLQGEACGQPPTGCHNNYREPLPEVVTRQRAETGCPEDVVIDHARQISTNKMDKIAELTAELRQLQRMVAQQAHPRAESSPVKWAAYSCDNASDSSDGDCEQGGNHKLQQADLERQLEALDARHEARLADVAALAAGAGRVKELTARYDRTVAVLAKERDGLQAERADLIQAVQKMAAVESASAEERERIRSTYRVRLKDMDVRLRALAARAIAAQQAAKLQARSEATCARLESDIVLIRHQKVVLMKQIEQSKKEVSESRKQRDKEILQLRRQGLRTEAAMAKQGQLLQKKADVLRRKLEHADASRSRLERIEGVRRRGRARRARGCVRRSVLGSDREEEDCQPCAAAPLLRDEGARRSWVESELAACCVAQDLRRVLDGEVVARSAAVARLREAEKAVAGTHAASLELSPTPPGVTPAQRNTDDRAALDARLAALQAEVDAHSEEIARTIEALMTARGEDEARGAGAADVRRWTAVRTTVQARAMLRTVFRAAAANAAQVLELETVLAEERESAQLARLRLHIARASCMSADNATAPPMSDENTPLPQQQQARGLPTNTGSPQVGDQEVASLMAAIEKLAPRQHTSNTPHRQHMATPMAARRLPELNVDEGTPLSQPSPHAMQGIASPQPFPGFPQLPLTPSNKGLGCQTEGENCQTDKDGSHTRGDDSQDDCQSKSDESQAGGNDYQTGGGDCRTEGEGDHMEASDAGPLPGSPPLPSSNLLVGTADFFSRLSPFGALSLAPSAAADASSECDQVPDSEAIAISTPLTSVPAAVSPSQTDAAEQRQSGSLPDTQQQSPVADVSGIDDPGGGRDEAASVTDLLSDGESESDNSKEHSTHSDETVEEEADDSSSARSPPSSPLSDCSAGEDMPEGDHAWLPETATPNRRATPRRSMRQRGSSRLGTVCASISRSPAAFARQARSYDEAYRIVLAAINSDRAANGRSLVTRPTVRIITGFLRKHAGDGHKWTARNKRFDDLIFEAKHILGRSASGPSDNGQSSLPPQKQRARGATLNADAADDMVKREGGLDSQNSACQLVVPSGGGHGTPSSVSKAASIFSSRSVLGDASNRLLLTPGSIGTSHKTDSTGNKPRHSDAPWRPSAPPGTPIDWKKGLRANTLGVATADTAAAPSDGSLSAVSRQRAWF